MMTPTHFPVVAGTGGVRKMRFARPKNKRGKRDSFRVLYVYFPQTGMVALVTAYGKNEQGDIDAEDRKLFKEIVERVEKRLADGLVG